MVFPFSQNVSDFRGAKKNGHDCDRTSELGTAGED